MLACFRWQLVNRKQYTAMMSFEYGWVSGCKFLRYIFNIISLEHLSVPSVRSTRMLCISGCTFKLSRVMNVSMRNIHHQKQRFSSSFYHTCSQLWIHIKNPDANAKATLGQNATIHQVTTVLDTSKNVLFPGPNHLQTTGVDDPSLRLSHSLVLEQ